MDGIMQAGSQFLRYIDAYSDLLYLILLIPTMIFAVWAQVNVKSTFSKYSKIQNLRGITGAQAAQAVLRQHGIYDVKIECVPGSLTDHYDPRTNTIRLSETVYGADSIAAVGVAAHEAGHAVQYATRYFPVRVRTAIIPITQIGSSLAFPLVLLGILFSSGFLADIGIIFFVFAVIFQLVTLPVEYNASHRAMEALGTGLLLEEEEQRIAKKTLSAAALTYVAALASSVLSLLRLLAISRNSRRN